MIIDIKTKQDKIVLKVCGRLDTATAPQLEEELKGKTEGRKKNRIGFFGIGVYILGGFKGIAVRP